VEKDNFEISQPFGERILKGNRSPRLHPGTLKKFLREYHQGERMGPGILLSIAEHPRMFSIMERNPKDDLPSFAFLLRKELE
jgi:hypothetical protein